MTFIVAEAGVNHDGRLDQALRLVDIAKAAGADYIKFQIFDAASCKGPMRSTLAPLQLPWGEFRIIKAHCANSGIRFLASVFSCSDVDFIVDLGCSRGKVGSGELTNLKLIRHMGHAGLEMILSTGMATLDEIETALAEFQLAGGQKFTLLHCVSNYPTQLEHCNLRAIETLREEFRCPVGFSDHTLTSWAAIAAVSLGAVMLEKHFTYDMQAPGPDHRMSLQPDVLRDYVQTVRLTEKILGTGEKVLQPGEEKMRETARGRWDE